MLEIADLNQVIHATTDLGQTRITKGINELEKTKSVIKTTLNPFGKAANENVLSNIRNGNGEGYLLTAKDEGEKRRDVFIRECTRNHVV